jgi:RNA polymerase sigma factor (sigma-70 family)
MGWQAYNLQPVRLPVYLTMFSPLSADVSERDRLATLSQAYRASLRRYFERRISNKADADDLIQEVFLRLARRADFQSIRHLEGYLFEVAANVLQDRLRLNHSRAADRHGELKEVHSPEDFSPERVLIGRDSLGCVVRALRELPERVRIAFVLHRLEGLRHPEIATRLGVSVSAVEKYIIRALVHVKKRMEEQS